MHLVWFILFKAKKKTMKKKTFQINLNNLEHLRLFKTELNKKHFDHAVMLNVSF